MAKFPQSDIVALLDQDPTFNLGESTSKDLVLGEIMDADVIERLSQLGLGYGSSLGDEALRDEIATGLGVSADQVLVTVGGASALFMISFVLCDAGDEIVVAAPNFPPTLDVMAAVGARLVPLRLDFDGGYRFSIDDLRAALTPATRLVSLATPHNPSGRIFSIADCEAALACMAGICPDAYLVVDESYRETVYGDVAAPPSAAPLSPKVITSASVSKCHGAPGLRIGWLSCLDEALFEQLALAKLNTVLSCSVVDELLALEVLLRKETLFGERRQALAVALDKVAAWIETQRDFVDWVRPDGGALCCIRLRPDVYSDADVDAFLARLKVNDAMVAEGRWFDDETRVFRLGFGFLPLAILDDALAAVARSLADSVPARALSG